MTRTDGNIEWPVYEFGSYMGPTITWFAWYPVKLWYGRWAWFKNVQYRAVMKKSYLDGREWQFWTYNDAETK